MFGGLARGFSKAPATQSHFGLVQAVQCLLSVFFFFILKKFIFENWKKKKLQTGLSPLGWATGVYFRNFSKWTYIFEILIFLNIKKKKSRLLRPTEQIASSRSHLASPLSVANGSLQPTPSLPRVTVTRPCACRCRHEEDQAGPQQHFFPLPLANLEASSAACRTHCIGGGPKHEALEQQVVTTTTSTRVE